MNLQLVDIYGDINYDLGLFQWDSVFTERLLWEGSLSHMYISLAVL